jgi:hypothetical protein
MVIVWTMAASAEVDIPNNPMIHQSINPIPIGLLALVFAFAKFLEDGEPGLFGV